ncbi:ubiquinone/menaquinone biosynthesis methyltransferase [Simiduia sp. 21SJ11W-1]|uniref:ubiquinone/menaquinone biosynthesis methyltransferase n=1 Tax=Simiduia sp. 21SJ11W-1 TaxID=2909669 RepID=UPI00209D0D41|nr:ubiquinone/menaquinone biosynthesis methyltransferase [Simiduia sp. 21SJ11W-1]UTA48099.1 ubiquinone/menaquinone biosynthesis methyltransferase [Simiduia sp. 21SJ11W-1]
MRTESSNNAAGLDVARDNIFARIADRYDWLCDIFSFGIHRYWKSVAVKEILRHKPQVILDAAAGTGDISVRLVQQKELHPSTIVVSDICDAMLRVAQKRLARHTHAHNLEFAPANAERLSEFNEQTFDCYVMSFALKICNRQRVLEAAYGVLKPGGVLIMVEASRIKPAWLQALYLAYMSLCMPIIGWLATGGDASAYKYLLTGVKDIPDAEVVAEEISACGFTQVNYRRLSLGIVAIHSAIKPPALT